jgi:hypothetical protein
VKRREFITLLGGAAAWPAGPCPEGLARPTLGRWPAFPAIDKMKPRANHRRSWLITESMLATTSLEPLG